MVLLVDLVDPSRALDYLDCMGRSINVLTGTEKSWRWNEVVPPASQYVAGLSPGCRTI